MTFAQHVNWLLRLAEPSTFNYEKTKFINDDSDGKGTIIDKKRGIVEKIREDVKGYDCKVRYNFDDVILEVTKFYTDNPLIQIVKPYVDENIDAQLSAWVQLIEKAKLYIRKNPSFYSKFPQYQEALSLTISTLRELRKPSTPSQKSKKSDNARKLKSYLEIIQKADSKHKAINKIQEIHPKFSWDRPNKTWYHANSGKLNKEQVAHALYLIGSLKFSNNYPGTSTIKTTLLNHL